MLLCKTMDQRVGQELTSDNHGGYDVDDDMNLDHLDLETEVKASIDGYDLTEDGYLCESEHLVNDLVGLFLLEQPEKDISMATDSSKGQAIVKYQQQTEEEEDDPQDIVKDQQQQQQQHVDEEQILFHHRKDGEDVNDMNLDIVDRNELSTICSDQVHDEWRLKVLEDFSDEPHVQVVEVEGDGSRMTVVKLKKCCSCKKTRCSRKYCECFKAGVGCSNDCKCESCENVHGRRNDGNNNGGNGLIASANNNGGQNTSNFRPYNGDHTPVLYDTKKTNPTTSLNLQNKSGGGGRSALGKRKCTSATNGRILIDDKGKGIVLEEVQQRRHFHPEIVSQFCNWYNENKRHERSNLYFDPRR